MRPIDIDAVIKNALTDTEREYLKSIARNAPTIDAVPQWIPCEERLPDKNCDVLVTFIPSAGNLWKKVIIANYSDLMGTIGYRIFWTDNYGKNDFLNITDQVSAWMPLPEPYAERKDNAE